jgi:hypothetical protein
MLEERVTARDEQFNYTNSPYIQVGPVTHHLGAQRGTASVNQSSATASWWAEAG